MKEELKLVESFDELRAGMIVVVKDCEYCDASAHRGILAGFDPNMVDGGEDAWRVMPPAHSGDGIDGSYSWLSAITVERRAVYRVIDGLESETTTERKKVTVKP